MLSRKSRGSVERKIACSFSRVNFSMFSQKSRGSVEREMAH